MQTKTISHDDITRIRGLLDCYQIAPGGEVADGLLAECKKILLSYVTEVSITGDILAGATINDITERDHWHAESIREGLADAEAGNLTPIESFKRKPAGDGWISHQGGPCPVRIGAYIQVLYRNGDKSFTRAQSIGWQHYQQEDDIVAYRHGLSRPEANLE